MGVRQQSLLSNAPLFVDDRGHSFSRDLFISYLRQVISHLEFSPTEYCGHSFRIRASTTAAAVGIEDHMIKTLGRWKFSCNTDSRIYPLNSLRSQGSFLENAPLYKC